jgi:hypothetical protein
MMVIHKPNNVDSVHPVNNGTPAKSQAGVEKDDACRCKATSEMSPGELLKLMVSDLAFWKKTKKG